MSKTIKKYESIVKSGKYTLLVRTVDKYWEGHDSGKMEDAPGNFLKYSVSLKGCSGKLSPIETLAVQNHVVLFKNNKEISDEPKGYAKLFHNNLVKEVKKSPDYYLQNMQKAVKELL